MSYRRHAVVVREIDFGYRGVPFPRQRHQRRIVQQRKIDLRGLRARDRVLGHAAVAGGSFDPRAHCGETVEIALDSQRAQRGAELQSGVPREEIPAGVTGRIQVQRFGPVHRLQAGRMVEGAGLLHQVGEMILQTGRPHAVRASLHRVAYAAAYGTHRRLTVEATEDVARSEPDEQPPHFGQHVCGEEGDGDGVTVLQTLPQRGRQRGAHLLQGVPVSRLQPRGKPCHAPCGVPSHNAALKRADRARRLAGRGPHHRRRRPRLRAESRAVDGVQLLLLDEHEPRLHIMRIGMRVGGHEHAPVPVGERDLRETVMPDEQPYRDGGALPRGQLRPSQRHTARDTGQVGKHAALDKRRQSHRMLRERGHHRIRVVAGPGRGLHRRLERSLPVLVHTNATPAQYGRGGVPHLSQRAGQA